MEMITKPTPGLWREVIKNFQPEEEEKPESTTEQEEATEHTLKDDYKTMIRARRELTRMFQEDGDKGFYDFCEKFLGLSLPKKENGDKGYELAETLLVHWGQLSDELTENLINRFLGGEQKYSLFEELKINNPAQFVKNINNKDRQKQFETMRKLILIKIFANISSHLSGGPFELHSTVYENIQSINTERINDAIGNLWKKNEQKEVINKTLKYNMCHDAMSGKAFAWELLNEAEKVEQACVYDYEKGEDARIERELKPEELKLLNHERVIKRPLEKSFRFLYLEHLDEYIPVMILQREKPIISYAFKMLRTNQSAGQIDDIFGIKFVFLSQEDVQKAYPALKKIFSPLEDTMQNNYFKGTQNARSSAASPKYQNIKWIATENGDLEIQITDLLNYTNSEEGVNGGTHDVYRVIQYLQDVLPMLFPENIYGTKFDMRKELKTIAIMLYDQYVKVWNPGIYQAELSKPENAHMTEEEFARYHLAEFINIYLKRLLYSAEDQYQYLPITIDLIQKEIKKDEEGSGAKANFIGEAEKTIGDLLFTGREEREKTLNTLGFDEADKLILLDAFDVVDQNEELINFVLENERTKLLKPIRSKKKKKRYNELLDEAISKEVAETIVEMTKKELGRTMAT